MILDLRSAVSIFLPSSSLTSPVALTFLGALQMFLWNVLLTRVPGQVVGDLLAALLGHDRVLAGLGLSQRALGALALAGDRLLLGGPDQRQAENSTATASSGNSFRIADLQYESGRGRTTRRRSSDPARTPCQPRVLKQLGRKRDNLFFSNCLTIGVGVADAGAGCYDSGPDSRSRHAAAEAIGRPIDRTTHIPPRRTHAHGQRHDLEHRRGPGRRGERDRPHRPDDRHEDRPGRHGLRQRPGHPVGRATPTCWPC